MKTNLTPRFKYLFPALAALFLVLNGIYGRCYLWHILHISSCGCSQLSRQQYCDGQST